MEKLNTETLVSSLMVYGFDKVDSLLFAYTLGKLAKDNTELKWFEFSDDKVSSTFNDYIECDGFVYKIKDGLSLDSEILLKNGKVVLRDRLNSNQKLLEYFDGLDFESIINKKIKALGEDKIDSFDHLFSDKEKEMIRNSRSKTLKLNKK